MVLSLSPRLLAWGRLLRVSLFATAAADPVVGAFLGSGGAPPGRALLAPLASLCVYHGAMALNDLADREEDAANGRSRPLVEGLIGPGSAAAAVVLLLAAGLGLAFVAGGSSALAWLGVTAAVAVVYDLVGRGPWIGPSLLALARGGNLLFGAVCAGWQPTTGSPLPWLAATGYAAYVLVVSRLGRMEDGAAGQDLGRAPSRLLGILAGLLIGVPLATGLFAWVSAWLGPGLPTGLHLVAALAGAFVGRRQSRTAAMPLLVKRHQPDWTPAQVEGVMGLALSRLLPLTVACLLLATPTPAALLAAAVLILAGRAGRSLMATFPPS